MKKQRKISTEQWIGYPLRDPKLKVVLREADPSDCRNGTSVVKYGFSQSPFGELFIASIAGGIVGLTFTDGNSEDAVENFREHNGSCRLYADNLFARRLIDIAMGSETCGLTGSRAGDSKIDGTCGLMVPDADGSITVCVDGTMFQKEVWGALLTIPFGQTVTYGQLARMIGKPKAVRAVASAVALNRIACIIPCHRVVRSDGRAGGYRWGPTRKADMIAWEKITCKKSPGSSCQKISSRLFLKNL